MQWEQWKLGRGGAALRRATASSGADLECLPCHDEYFAPSTGDFMSQKASGSWEER
jgi:hypothetical protein